MKIYDSIGQIGQAVVEKVAKEKAKELLNLWETKLAENESWGWALNDMDDEAGAVIRAIFVGLQEIAGEKNESL